MIPFFDLFLLFGRNTVKFRHLSVAPRFIAGFGKREILKPFQRFRNASNPARKTVETVGDDNGILAHGLKPAANDSISASISYVLFLVLL